MPRKGYYSPALRRDLVKRLYFAAKDLRIPMTVLNDRLVVDSLNRICEQAPAIIPIRRATINTRPRHNPPLSENTNQPARPAQPHTLGFFVHITTERKKIWHSN